MRCPVGANGTMAFQSHVHAPNGHRVTTCQRGSVGATRTPWFQSHALTGHRIPAQGANPGNPPGNTNQRSEETPHTLRVLDIDSGPPYAVFLQNTLFLSDAVPWVGTLGWYALPRGGKWNDGISIPCLCHQPEHRGPLRWCGPVRVD
jgi:hypothetical protein